MLRKVRIFAVGVLAGSSLLIIVGSFIWGFPSQSTVVGSAPGVAGFADGLWNGFTIGIAFIVSLFSNAGIYEVHNNGSWYNGGYFIGVMAPLLLKNIFDIIAFFLKKQL